MKTSQLKRILVSAFIFAALTACTDSSITEVKKSSIAQSDFTFGETLDNAKGCKTTEWDHRDESGRSIVQYTCTAAMPLTLVERAGKENINSIKALIKAFDEDWQLSLKTLEERKNYVSGAIVQARTNNEAKLNEGNAQLREAQERLSRALASSPESYIGHGPSGYTPQLIEMGKERMQLDILKAKREVEAVQRRIEATEAAQNAPTDAAQQSSLLGQYRSPSEYQVMIDGMLSWKDRYYAAINESEAREIKKAEEFLIAAKDRTLQMKITFLVRKKFPVQIQSATWNYDGKEYGAVNSIYLAAVLLDPKRMQELIEGAQRSHLKLEIDSLKLEKSFPIACGEKILTGCELRKVTS